MNRVTDVDNQVKINHVLMSVFDKTGIDQFVPNLIKINPDVKIYSTGGTYKLIRELLGENHQKNLIPVSEYTGQPEMQGGLVKTLDFKIYLGMLSETYNTDHKDDLKRTEAVELDMVVVNLYPFQETISKEGVSLEDARANIDIGGPTMVRASAKNYLRVASVCNPEDYTSIIQEMEEHSGRLSFATRFNLAQKSFRHTADYDQEIAKYLAKTLPQDAIAGYTVRN